MSFKSSLANNSSAVMPNFFSSFSNAASVGANTVYGLSPLLGSARTVTVLPY
ncbi:hypothetical protein LCL98_10750 [Rossellomorea aquimaris]|nr:hypothetical protein [Rossellomorea aquimaris]